MIKNNLYKKFLSAFLIFVFLLPIIIKATHHLYIHHEHFHHTTNTEKQFHKLYFKCPICDFKFIEYVKGKNLLRIQKPEYVINIYNLSTEDIFIAFSCWVE